jgi:hypothetical protein
MRSPGSHRTFTEIIFTVATYSTVKNGEMILLGHAGQLEPARPGRAAHPAGVAAWPAAFAARAVRCRRRQVGRARRTRGRSMTRESFRLSTRCLATSTTVYQLPESESNLRQAVNTLA